MDEEGESLKDINKLVNNEHSKAYRRAIREARDRGESEARHCIFFFVFQYLCVLCIFWSQILLLFMAVLGIFWLQCLKSLIHSVLDSV